MRVYNHSYEIRDNRVTVYDKKMAAYLVLTGHFFKGVESYTCDGKYRNNFKFKYDDTIRDDMKQYQLHKGKVEVSLQ